MTASANGRCRSLPAPMPSARGCCRPNADADRDRVDRGRISTLPPAGCWSRDLALATSGMSLPQVATPRGSPSMTSPARWRNSGEGHRRNQLALTQRSRRDVRVVARPELMEPGCWCAAPTLTRQANEPRNRTGWAPRCRSEAPRYRGVLSGSSRWLSTTAAARSTSLRFSVRDCSRSISKALASSMA